VKEHAHDGRLPILLVSEHYPPAIGGSAVLLENVYSRCPGAAVTVLTDAVGARTGGAIDAVVHARLKTPHWGLAHPGGSAHHFAAARTIRRIARRLGPDAVVHCGRALPEGIAARAAQLMGGRRFGCWIHGEDLASAATSRELSAVTRWVLNGSYLVLANSHNTKAFAVNFGIPAERIEVVHPGVDSARFNPTVDGTDIRRRHGLQDATIALSVGRLQARKGHDVAIRAVSKVLPHHPTLKYLIVGSGDERPRLAQLAGELGVSNSVIFAGEVPDDDVPAYFAACDLYLMPNRVEQGDFEGFGIVFLEAAATGRPSVGGDSGGVREAVVDGDTGLLVDGSNVDAVAAAIATLAASPEQRARLGRAGRGRVLREFSWEAAAAKVMAAHDARRRRHG
jgi:phosphatidylinositol alpha-1,6-mannosyltransferase